MANLLGNPNPLVHWTEVVDGRVVRGGTTHESAFGSLEPRQGGTIVRVDRLPRPPAPMKAGDAIKRYRAGQDYAGKRRAEYPPLADLADALYWQAQGDDTHVKRYFRAVGRVKRKHPKP